MSKIVKTVEITFENLEFVEIPAEFFGEFYIEGLRSSVERLSCNAILQRTKADKITFELLRDVESVVQTLTQDLFGDSLSGFSLQERIAARNDITSLTLKYNDDTTEQFYVTWQDADSDSRNILQHSSITDNANLIVTIGRQVSDR